LQKIIVLAGDDTIERRRGKKIVPVHGGRKTSVKNKA
jgi:hypothetical protein